jgi:tetratricopeptide (TPR) repeat protein
MADLLYDRAMVAEKLDRLDAMESDLRRVIELKPDHAHAYNALGYTFAERNQRLGEAYELVQKALAIAPNDAFIQDSLGWVQFRLGRLDEALKTLKGAYQLRRDPEIAAHLGEILWAGGNRDEALKILRASLVENPGNEMLAMMLKKFASP